MKPLFTLAVCMTLALALPDSARAADSKPKAVGYDVELVQQVVQRNQGQIRFCYESLLNRFAQLHGEVLVRFTLTPEGRVASASVQSSTAHNPELEQCVVRRVSGWGFPKPPGPKATVTYPFVFKLARE